MLPGVFGQHWWDRNPTNNDDDVQDEPVVPEEEPVVEPVDEPEPFDPNATDMSDGGDAGRPD